MEVDIPRPIRNFCLFIGGIASKKTLVLRFDSGAYEIFSSTACGQMVNRLPLEGMLLKIQGIKKVEFEIAGQVIEGWDA